MHLPKHTDILFAVYSYLSEVLPSCPHHLPSQKFCPDWWVYCLQLRPRWWCLLLHPPLGLRWSWWASWCFTYLEEGMKRYPVTGTRMTLAVESSPLTGKYQKAKEIEPYKSSGEAVKSSVWPQHGTNFKSLVSFLFVVWSSVLWTQGESAAFCTWRRPKFSSVSLPSLSLFLSLPFSPHCSKTIAPCDPLFTIWTKLESIHGEPCSSSLLL